MGSILTAIYDDYDDYKAFCECIGEEIMPIYHIKSFYEFDFGRKVQRQKRTHY